MSDDFDIEEDFEEEEKKTLKDIWDNNPFLKIGAVVIAIGAFMGAYSFLLGSGGEEELSHSKIKSGGGMKEAPGQEVPPAYKEAIIETNIRDAEMAALTGGSALPTPVGSGATSQFDVITEDSFETEDPLLEWKKAASARDIIMAEDDTEEAEDFAALGVVPTVEPIRPDPVSAVDPEAIESVSKQMAEIISIQMPPEMVRFEVVSKPSEYINMIEEEEKAKAAAEAEAEAGIGFAAAAEDGGTLAEGEAGKDDEVIVSAGKVLYAQLLNELNSDIEGPVLVHILSGPLAGGRAIGEFTLEDEYMVLEFDRIVKDSESYSIEGIALDPDTTLAGLSTDVDHHYFQRIVLPAAVEFISGVAEGIAGTNQTTVSGDGGVTTATEEELDTNEEMMTGVQKSMEKISEIIEESSDREITVKVAKGTVMGIFLMDHIKEGDKE